MLSKAVCAHQISRVRPRLFLISTKWSRLLLLFHLSFSSSLSASLSLLLFFQNVKTQLNNILVFPENGWLVDDYDGDPVRMSHMEKLRALCIPQVNASVLYLVVCRHVSGRLFNSIYQIYLHNPNEIWIFIGRFTNQH